MISCEKYFEKTDSLFKYGDYCVTVEECLCDGFKESLSKLKSDVEYLVAAWMVNELKLGYYQNGMFYFSESDVVEEKYLLEIRIFNEHEELYVVKRDDKFFTRLIREGSGEALKAVDSTSIIFGKKNAQLEAGFVKLVEKGRKISLVIPSSEDAEKYSLTTRSYIVVNNTTGQSGYGYYRWVRIAAAKGEN